MKIFQHIVRENKKGGKKNEKQNRLAKSRSDCDSRNMGYGSCCICINGSGYDVLDKIADSTSVGVSLEEKISDRIDASTSDMTYYLKRLDTLMRDYRAEKVTEVIGSQD